MDDTTTQRRIAGERILPLDDIEALALGAWILGTGGGGTPYLNLLNMRRLYGEGRTVTLKDPMSLKDDALVAVLSSQGAPLVGQERLSDPEVAWRAVKTLEGFIGRQFEAVMPVEIGGGNGVHPLMVAAVSGLPAIDADAMGRAYPEAQMTSFAVADLQCYPLAMADIRDNDIVIPRAASWKWMERISRKICVEMGLARRDMQGAAFRARSQEPRHSVHHVESDRARQGGDGGHGGGTPIRSRRSWTNAAGFGCSRARSSTSNAGRPRASCGDVPAWTVWMTTVTRISFSISRTSSRSAIADGKPVVMTPDLICVIDSDGGDGIGTDALRFGQRVTVLALPAPEVFLSPRGLELVGPRAFGFDFDYRSVFEDTRS